MRATITLQPEDLITGVASNPVTAIVGFDIIYLKGDKGNSAYEDAVEQGYTGTLEQWLESLHGGDGEDGVSPTVSISKVNGVTTVTITDKNGVHTATINDGQDGTDGTDGTDGISPTVSISKQGSVTTITITDANGEHTATINDGTDGTDGDDGISPQVSVSKVNGVTTITITDVNGQHTTTINDGTDGHTPVKGVDYLLPSERQQWTVVYDDTTTEVLNLYSETVV